ncbi:cation:proton antiporter [Corynebacterium phocae]|uniref:Cation:proton antiporter n=1 Tax=Corynebacterium phocae TaxID=161895 RepID=A0A1L7D2C5_9CORY|nr:Na+/H+ antiporter subunit G [Corynebacterium phocae]APT92295.1 cation:proton antiporter [Corynebacterium phocae]KAA8725329.1 Na+/H+ antiporter subunit G [Corynebacterium phocae]
MSIPEIIATVLVVIATYVAIACVITLWRAEDALTRVNLLSQLTGLSIPLLLLAKVVLDFAEQGFNFFVLIQVVLTLFGVWMMGAVASFYMARSIYGVTVTDVKHAKRLKGHHDPH